MTERINCLVPFCRRTAAREKYPAATQIICGKHYRLADKRLRRLYRLCVRRWDRQPATRSDHAYARLERLWNAIIAQVHTRSVE